MVKVEADINLNVPGLHFVLPCTEKLTAIDLRTQVFDVVPQEVNHLLHLVGSEIVVFGNDLDWWCRHSWDSGTAALSNEAQSTVSHF